MQDYSQLERFRVHYCHPTPCIFIGTGIGGGFVSGGRFVAGASGTAGELGHTTIVSDGRKCHCPNYGCLEAYAGGWGIAERAREAVQAELQGGAKLVEMAGSVEGITAATVGPVIQTG